jgi:hypothetical protein
MNTSSSADDISSLHGMRFANALGLLLCHKAMALFYYPYINRTELVKVILLDNSNCFPPMSALIYIMSRVKVTFESPMPPP